MKRRYMGTALFAIASLGRVAWADFGGSASTGQGRSPGFGVDLTANALPEFNGPTAVGFFPLSLRGVLGGVRYDLDLDVLTFPLSIDWRPFQNAFHVTAGVIVNEAEVCLGRQVTTRVDTGGAAYSATQLGVIRGDVAFNDIAPYIGIGWGKAFGKDRRWGLRTDLGVAFLGRPKVALTATGPIASDPAFVRDLAREEAEIEDDLASLVFHPVVSISLFYRF